MNRMYKLFLVFSCYFVLSPLCSIGQVFDWISSTEGNVWQSTSVKMEKGVGATVDLKVDDLLRDSMVFKAWGMTFNELGWDALHVLSPDTQDEIFSRLFSSEGDMGFTLGRIPMNANDYARSWYSCDEVSGDFQLKYFNIDRDKTSIIPYIREAQKYNPSMRF